MNLNQFLNALRNVLPEICADKDLVLHMPNIFKSLPTIHRRRLKGQIPPYFFIDPYYYYLREDVMSWLRSKYQQEESESHQLPDKQPKKLVELEISKASMP